MSRLLVTGGAGFIGANFVRYWAEKYPSDYVCVLDALTYAGNRQSLEPLLVQGKVAFVEGNICDQSLVESLLREHRIEAMVTKNSGGAMTRAKIDAATDLGIPIVMIDRPELPAGITTVDTVEDAIAWVQRLV